MINGEAFLMMDTGDPVYSSTELREMIDGGVLTISALKARKWEASCVESNAQSNFTDYYYELIPEDDKPIYAKITTVTGKDRIMGVVLYDKDQMLEDGIIYQIPANENASERAKETASEQENENVTESDIETEGDVTESNM